MVAFDQHQGSIAGLAWEHQDELTDARLARKMYEEDAPSVSLTGVLTNEAAREILETGREALRLKETFPVERVFDFSLAADALR